MRHGNRPRPLFFSFTLVLLLIAALPPAQALSRGACDQPVARLVSAQGVVETRAAQATAWRSAGLNDTFCPGDMLRVGARSRAAVWLVNETVVRLDQHATLTFSGLEDRETSWLDLAAGVAHFLSRVPRSLKVKTPYVNAAVEGTEFVVGSGRDEGSVTVLEGRVLVENAQGAVVLAAGESAGARAGEAPKARPVVHARDAVQWALYYPSLFDASVLTGDAAWAESARRSAAAYLTGDSASAFAAIAAVPGTVADARFFNYRAGLLLSVGRLDEAQDDITRSLKLASDNAHARALQSVIALARNDPAAALALAREANARDPASVPVWVALSYAQQAAFDLDGARASIEQALGRDPENVLVWARLSELWLALGDLDRALEAANRAVALDPNIARTQTVLGFAYLTRIKTVEAKQAFEKAIALDSADPLPRLGLGLAVIRSGDLENGRREIEIAASLDPDNALIRSYLGKAYYDEKRVKLAESQLAMAKQLDPNDPTPYFYDAIRQQSENRPVEALADLQKSIALNDNRAVYRSRLLLDQDLAARSASLARVYRDLGFDQLALREGTKSLSYDPSDNSAHRFLADAYSGLRRHEIARASETLQAQLLQPLNLNPVPPQLAETRLHILSGTGPAGAGFNEFNPLFERDRLTLQATGVAGSDGIRADELVLAGLHERVSYSLGQFHYETDGFRPNNDLTLNVANAFVQAAVTENSSLQFEWRSRLQRNGDLRMRFDPADFSTAWREKRDEDTVRLGYHLRSSPNSGIILSAIRRDTDFTRQDSQVIADAGPPFGLPVISSEDRHEEITGSHVEAEGFWRAGRQRNVLGAGYYDNESNENPGIQITSGPVTLVSDTATTTTKETHRNAYGYTYVSFSPDLVATLGLSGDKLRFGTFETDQTNPKLGLAWTVRPDTLLRLAAFRTLKRSLVANQTIEPTQVAGFNQLFDDPAGTDAKRYGLALDQNLGAGLFGGFELSVRKLDVPLFSSGTALVDVENQNERAHRAYLYWTPHPAWGVGTEYHYEAFERELNANSDLSRPVELITRRLPISMSYFSPAGFFARFTETPFHQDVTQQVTGATATDSDRFWIADLTLGYRFPKRRGLLSLEVRNLFDQEFRFYDLDFQSAQPRVPIIQPDRLVLIKLALSWN